MIFLFLVLVLFLFLVLLLLLLFTPSVRVQYTTIHTDAVGGSNLRTPAHSLVVLDW